jgi:hypothetical protein
MSTPLQCALQSHNARTRPLTTSIVIAFSILATLVIASSIFHHLLPGSRIQTCLICSDDKTVRQCAVLSCNHTYCLECLEHIIDNGIKEKTTHTIICPEPGCRKPMGERDIRRITSNNYKKIMQITAIRTRDQALKQPGAQECSTPDCNGIFIDIDENAHTVTCNECKKTYCSKCKEEHITGQCQFMNDKATQEWLQSNDIRPCPSCKYGIQKNEGCSSMVCGKCKHKFCWECGGSFDHVKHLCQGKMRMANQ